MQHHFRSFCSRNDVYFLGLVNLILSCPKHDLTAETRVSTSQESFLDLCDFLQSTFLRVASLLSLAKGVLPFKLHLYTSRTFFSSSKPHSCYLWSSASSGWPEEVLIVSSVGLFFSDYVAFLIHHASSESQMAAFLTVQRIGSFLWAC